MTEMTAPERADVVIAGGGTVGLVLALAIRTADPHARVILADARPLDAVGRDDRASAIAAAVRRMLDRLGVWHRVADVAEPILSMEVTDSRLADRMRPVFLTFEGTVAPGEPFAHMVPNADLLAALQETALAAGVEIRAPAAVKTFTPGAGWTRVTFVDGTEVEARLLVAADGLESRLRALAGIGTVGHDYDQSAIVTTVAHEKPHHGVAVQHFLPPGPFAILPLKGNRSSLVWNETRDTAARIAALDEFSFELELERRFGTFLGKVTPVGSRSVFPLQIRVARRFVGPRLALAGDAAHRVHPIAGQGLNLGFRDAAALAEVIVEARRLGRDPGAPDVLDGYDRWRRVDTLEMGTATDTLNRLFATDLAPVRAARDFGLGLVDRLPSLKRTFITRAAGLAERDQPRLLSGQAI